MPRRPTTDLIETSRRRRFLIQKAIAGHSRREIARAAVREFGEEKLPEHWGPLYVAKDFKRVLGKLQDEIAELAEEYRTIQITRLESILKELMPMCRSRTGTEYTDEGEPYTVQRPPSMKAIDRVLKITDRLERLYGTDELPPVRRPGRGEGDNYFFTQINNAIREGQ